MKKDLQNGRSMIEMLGVLSIIGILTVGGFSLVSKAVTENKINNVIDEISALAQHTRVVFREFVYKCRENSSGTEKKCATGTDMTESLKKASAYPDVLEYTTCSDSDKKCFIDNEELEMSVSFLVEDEVEYYVLKIAGPNKGVIPEDICMAIANGNWGTPATNGFSGIAFKNDENLIGGTIGLANAAANDGCGAAKTIFLVFR